MPYKKIYTCKRNHITIASGTSVRDLLLSVRMVASVDDLIWLPAYSSLARALRLHTRASVKTINKNIYEFEELQNSRYKRKKM